MYWLEKSSLLCVFAIAVAAMVAPTRTAAQPNEPFFKEPINVVVPHISTDKSVRYDYDIVYVRARRAGDEIHKRFYTDIATPVTLEPGADLMLLHPDGSEERLVEGGEGSVTDPMVSFDGKWVYYTYIYSLANAGPWSPPRKGADIFKINLASKKIVRLTNQRFTPNTGAADWASDFRANEKGKTHLDYGVLNFGPCPLPGGKIVYTSNRDAFRPSKGYPRIALQLFVMDDRDESVPDDVDNPSHIEKIGHLNIAGALHPVVLADGRIIFSSLESQGLRGDILWGIWSIHPDGTNWGPVISAFDPGGAPNAFHFQAQLSDGSLVIEEYYNQNNSGFGTYIKLPTAPPAGYAQFGPASMHDPRNKPWRFGRFDNGKGHWYSMPFMPTGSEALTPFTHAHDGPADPSILGDKNSPKVGKFTHPTGAPDNHLLTIYSPGPANHQYKYLPQLDGGIYLIKDGRPIDEPAQMLLIKNDPQFNESWPRAVVPYQRIYGIAEPKRLEPLANDGRLSPHLPAGTPFGLVGSSSLYKRESYPNGVVPEGKVTAEFGGGNEVWKGLDAFTSHGNGMPINWHNQGAEAGLYTNDEIHAVRILAMEPTTDRQSGDKSGRLFHSHAHERLRILGEVPVRKFVVGWTSGPSKSNAGVSTAKDGPRVHPTKNGQPTDPDGNPDTSFLVKIPADTAFTFQTLDKHGMLLNASQTWHQLRPGEIRHNCGGCHAHSQAPTKFEETAAARPDYKVWDLTASTPLVTSKEKDDSKHKWDAANTSGLRTVKQGVVNVEYQRDIRPILARSCIACHAGDEPAGKLNLAADEESVSVENQGKFPGTYARLALDERGKFGHKPIGYDSWGFPQASRYIRKFQSRRSLLTWKVYGKRLDGFSNDDHPSETSPGSGELAQAGKPVDLAKNRHRYDVDFVGSIMPPPAAVAGTYKGADGQPIKVAPLSDEDRRTLVRWIDLGCPIDLDYDPARSGERGFGWMCDDNRPVLTVTHLTGKDKRLERILIGMTDYYSGLDESSLSVTASIPIDGIAAGENLASKFKATSPGVWEYKLVKPLAALKDAELTASVKDRQGNMSRLIRPISTK